MGVFRVWVACVFPVLFISSCTGIMPDDDEAPLSNRTDITNGNASFVGSGSCITCHPQIADAHAIHGHANILSPITGDSPVFPEEAERASVPTPPNGFAWSDISWVIGGYTKQAVFLDLEGNQLTNGTAETDSTWVLSFLPNGHVASFEDYQPDAEKEPYSFECLSCHVTGPEQSAKTGEFQENRPGIEGTWAEPGVMCEACHGPGSNHFATVPATEVNGSLSATASRAGIYTDLTGESTCLVCHRRTPAGDELLGSEGFVQSRQQAVELAASGGHASFSCRTCHDPHRSVNYDRDLAIRNECQACHSDQNMAFHDDKLFDRGDYSEILSCESCHMPYAVKRASQADEDVVAEPGRVGDTRSHIFRISTDPDGFTSMFSADQTQVNLDDQGQAAITVDFVCLRCHNQSTGGLFPLTVEQAAEIAIGMHRFADEFPR
ncbi:MAG: multiheme c-type cytochrome [Planctomycetota bacterium]|jgi:hypothetical protein